MAEGCQNSSSQKRTRQALTLEKKLELIDQSRQTDNVSEFARENGLQRRQLYKLRRQEQTIRAAISAAPTTKPLRKRMNWAAPNREKVKRHKPGEHRGDTINTEESEPEVTGSVIEVKPKIQLDNSEDDVMGKS